MCAKPAVCQTRATMGKEQQFMKLVCHLTLFNFIYSWCFSYSLPHSACFYFHGTNRILNDMDINTQTRTLVGERNGKEFDSVIGTRDNIRRSLSRSCCKLMARRAEFDEAG